MTNEVVYDYVVSIMIWFSIWMIFELLYSSFAKTKVQKLFISTVMFFSGVTFIYYRNTIIDYVSLIEKSNYQPRN